MKSLKPKDILYKPTFTDAKFEDLDFELDKNFIISRILSGGIDKDIYFICDFYDKEVIMDVLKSAKGPDPKVINYFESVL